MNDTYSDFVRNLMKDMGDKTQNILHAAVGLSGESGEVLDLVKKHWAYGKPLDVDKLVEELGDIMFYFQAMCNAIGVPPEHVMLRNVAKLSERYSSGTYSDAQAIAREDVKDE